MNLTSEEKKKIGEEAQRRYNATPALKNHYGTFKSYLGKAVKHYRPSFNHLRIISLIPKAWSWAASKSAKR